MLAVFGFTTFGQTASWAGELTDELAALQRGNFKTALKRLKPLAESEAPNAQFYLCLLYQNDEGVVTDKTEAAGWYSLSAEQGYTTTQFKLGVMYANR